MSRKRKSQVEESEVEEEVEEEQEEVEPVADNMYTYVGSGDTPPPVTNFLGRQKFVRGKLTEVTDPIVLSKIKNHACFRKGEVNPDELFERDEQARAFYEEVMKRDRETNARFHKKHKQVDE